MKLQNKNIANMIEKGAANSVIAKRRCLYCFLVGVMFIIATNIGITALLLYYINLSKVINIPNSII